MSLAKVDVGKGFFRECPNGLPYMATNVMVSKTLSSGGGPGVAPVITRRCGGDFTNKDTLGILMKLGLAWLARLGKYWGRCSWWRRSLGLRDLKWGGAATNH